MSPQASVTCTCRRVIRPEFCPPNVLSLSRSRPSHSGSATRSAAQNEARKRRANERPRVGCCEELGFAPQLFQLLLVLRQDSEIRRIASERSEALQVRDVCAWISKLRVKKHRRETRETEDSSRNEENGAR